ncbi:hybrid sensor histidine kinase/response regulator [Halopelagius longus]|uniref:histidine kinase n=1 Tax=Halopelagius longus TaxID=1236180 RepID=A0A1H1A939_9EURY|nr:response regulator [Halopelagius longus]RDI70289.1 response regulator [Halopelagius longus]SDQ36245.1 PAS domain S-box-containing protein [Halopelagius longus]
MVGLRDGVTVLHVDDEPELSSLVATYLEREAADVELTVETTERPREALSRVEDESSPVDCVVSDYEMPEMDGLSFLRAVRTARPNLPFILYTGKGSEEVARDAFRVGATDYMQKGGGSDQYAVLANRVLNAVSRYRAQAESRRYGTVFEALNTAVYVLDESGRFTAVDDVFVELSGYDREDILGEHVSALTPEGAEETLSAKLDSVVSDDADTVRFEADVRTADRERVRCVGTMGLRSLDISGRSPVGSEAPCDDGKGGVVGTLQDVTEQRRRQETVRYHAKLKDVVLDTSTTLMSAELDEIETKIHWTLQSIGEFLDVDRCTVSRYDADVDGLRKTNEWTAPDADGQPASVTADDCEWIIERLRQFEDARSRDGAMLPPDASGLPAAFDLPDDAAFVAVPMVSNWSLSGAVTLVSEDARSWPNEEVSLLRTAADMLSHTMERRRREEELRRQNERLEEFASVVSHDLRNPMNVADGFVELARETGNVAHLDRASSALDRMDVLVSDVLELARQGRTVGDTSPVDLTQVVERSWRAVDTGDAVLSVSDSLGVVSADEGRLAQAIENLFRNSVEHGSTSSRPKDGDSVEHGSTDSGPEYGADLTVSVGPLDGDPGFYVADDGSGIPEEKRDRVFEHGHTTSEGGSGFGLSIVESIVEAHGWNIRAAESAAGGARFEIRTASRAPEFEVPVGHAETD